MYLLVFCTLQSLLGRFYKTEADLWTSDFFVDGGSQLSPPDSFGRPDETWLSILDDQSSFYEPELAKLDEEVFGSGFMLDDSLSNLDDFVAGAPTAAAPADHEPNSPLVVCRPPPLGLPSSAEVNYPTSSNQTGYHQDCDCDTDNWVADGFGSSADSDVGGGDPLALEKKKRKLCPKCSSNEGVSALLTSENGILSADKTGDHGKSAFPGKVNAAGHEVKCLAPEIWMSFSSEEAAFEFYNNYASQSGFRVRKGKVQRLSDGTISKRHFYCSKEGFRSTKQSMKTTKYKRKETRTGCQARIQLNVEEGNWVISKAILEHNHNLEIKSSGRQIRDPCAFNSKTRSVCKTSNDVGTEKEVGAEKNDVGFNSLDDRVEELAEVCNGPLNAWETKLERKALDIIHKVKGRSQCLELLESRLEKLAEEVENILEAQSMEDDD